jgi:hypothetical protein
VHLPVFFPVSTVPVEAVLLSIKPSFNTRVGRLDRDPVVVDALLNPVELALDGELGLLRGRHRVAFERLQPAIDAVQLDAKVAAKSVDVLSHRVLLTPKPA